MAGKKLPALAAGSDLVKSPDVVVLGASFQPLERSLGGQAVGTEHRPCPTATPSRAEGQ